MRTHLRIIGLITLLLSLYGGAAMGQPIACPDTLASRLVAGEYAQVTPGAANRVRAEPSTAGELLGEIPGEGIFAVLHGPECADGFAWWQIQYGELIGWTVEGRDDYWLEPIGPLRADSPILTGIGLSQRADYRGVSFGFDPAVALEAVGETVAASSEGSPLFDEPEHILFSFTRYPAGYDPVELRVYPVEAYERVKQADLSALRQTLAERPSPLNYTASAVVNAAMVIGVGSRYVTFEDGQGVRSLVHWAQAPDRVASLYYVFNGLTDDGAYYIQAIFALTDLPELSTEDSARFEVDYEDFLDSFGDYQSLMADHFMRAPAGAFTPNLHQLDALIASLRVAVISVEEADEIARSRPTATPFPTATPSPTPAPLPECTLIAFNDTNLRRTPDFEGERIGVLRADREYTGIARFERPGEGFPWWLVDADTRPFMGSPSGWVRADFVEEIGDCDALPFTER